MYYLGINNIYHESSACLVRDGRIVSYAEEERLNRIKHAKPAQIDNPDVLPDKSINYCLASAGISGKDIKKVGISFLPEKRAKNIYIKEATIRNDWGSKRGEKLFISKINAIPDRLKEILHPKIEVVWLDHHKCHAASSFYVSPFEESALLVVDGIAEFDTVFLGHATGNRIDTFKRIEYPNSLGFLWEKISKFLGFTEYDAGKIMGLSAYGNANVFYQKFKNFVKINQKGLIIDLDVVRFRSDDYSGLEKILGVGKRTLEKPVQEEHANIAASLQKTTEECLLNLTNYLYTLSKSKNLCFSGGVALNCVANTTLLEKGKFKNLFIPPHCNDAGTSIGAAFLLEQSHEKRKRIPIKYFQPYWPSSFENGSTEKLLLKRQYDYSKPKDINSGVANLLAKGEIIAHYQGNSEIGPRALGNRSILVSPVDFRTKERINFNIKDREFFRPIAPMILEEFLDEYFEIPKNKSLAYAYMLLALKVKGNQIKKIPAVVHIDRTARIQVVSKKMNQNLHDLLSKFNAKTGIPVLVNTSFNRREPIVHTPDEALNTFERMRNINYLVINEYLIKK